MPWTHAFPEGSAPVTDVPRILVKAPNWVGDCVMATPALALMRKCLPEAVIDVLARPSVAAVFRCNPDINTLLDIDERAMPAEARAVIRENRYDAVAIMPNSLGSAWLVFRLWIGKRIGFARGGRGLLLTHPLHYDPYEWQTCTPEPLSRRGIRPRGADTQRAPGHMVEYYLRIAEATLTALGHSRRPDPHDEPGPLVLNVHSDAAAQVDRLLGGHGLAGKTLIGINPGAAYGAAKRWPVDRLGETAGRLAELHGAAIVSTASIKETELNDQVAAASRAAVHRLGEQLDLQGLIALVDRLALLVTNDSGAMHIAAARSVPTLAVFGPTDWNVTRPWDSNAQVMRCSPACAPCFLRDCPIDHRCMTAVGVDDVVRACGHMLAGAQARGRTHAP